MSNPVTFPFSIGDTVKIKASGETGTVRGLSILSSGTTSALLHYKAGDGRAVDAWWETDVLEAA
ncbi:hypothetical protein [Azospirillum brasilense]|uniref:hypothetical protein n=1 Tax=Azospirillum brasilense TaxID=192 RepID=UPI001EDB86A0|nr:hypothetical protein [Azospirillum brasilense]UKJ74549.1 hypothetical protein H1Q64_18495 [Azospirillum brasilense]